MRQHKGELNSDTMWESEQGRTDFTLNPSSNITVATDIKNPDNLFDRFVENLKQVLPPRRSQGMALA